MSFELREFLRHIPAKADYPIDRGPPGPAGRPSRPGTSSSSKRYSTRGGGWDHPQPARAPVT